jgi:signal-transduction protein with cAMP-binding, CBS, and nucleotidyltransferase domain
MINPFAKTFSTSELETFQFLSQIRFFEKLKNAEMSRFLSAIHYRKYSKDEVIFFRSDPSHAFYVVKSGLVNLTLEIKNDF